MNDILKKCLTLESSMFVDLDNNTQVLSKKGYLITTNTDTVLSLCDAELNRDIMHVGNDIIIFEKPTSLFPINIIVTKSYLLYDWDVCEKTNVFYDFTSFSKFLSSNVSRSATNSLTAVISETVFLKNVQYFSKNVYVKRLIIDNIILNTAFKKKMSVVKYSFLWLIYNKTPNIHDNSQLLVKKLFIYDIPLLTHDTKQINVIHCKKPYIISTLSELIDKSIEEEVSALDINLVLQHLSSKNIQPENRILDKVLNKLKTTLNNIEIKESSLNEIVYQTEEDKTERLLNITNKKHNIQEKISQIHHRITSNELCFICYSEIDTKTVMKCCYNVVCFICINKWLNNAKKCPLCKKCNPGYFVYQNDHIPSNDIISLSDENTIFENFIVLIKKLYLICDCYVMILGNDDDVINKFEMIMQRIDISFHTLRGNARTFRKYAMHHSKIITLNSVKYENGIILKRISDIIILHDTKVKSTLIEKCSQLKKVWKLCYL
jgi:hypothetical protein